MATKTKPKQKVVPISLNDDVKQTSTTDHNIACAFIINGIEIRLFNGADDLIIKAVLAEALHAR
jgi:hypothetical protein